MFPRTDITIDRDILDAVLDNAKTAPGRFNRQYQVFLGRLQTNVLTRLRQEPGQPKYPIRWTSERQRKYVMAKLRRMGQIPYQRTGGFVAAWQTSFTATQDGGLFSVTNTAKTDKGLPLEPFVTGDRQQGFHRDTGWYQSQDILADALVEAEDAAIQLWDETLRL